MAGCTRVAQVCELIMVIHCLANPDAGTGHAYFLCKAVAAQMRIPTSRKLREESQRRMKAARKKKWAEYRLAKEIASGKLMRRLLRASRPAQRP